MSLWEESEIKSSSSTWVGKCCTKLSVSELRHGAKYRSCNIFRNFCHRGSHRNGYWSLLWPQRSESRKLLIIQHDTAGWVFSAQELKSGIFGPKTAILQYMDLEVLYRKDNLEEATDYLDKKSKNLFLSNTSFSFVQKCSLAIWPAKNRCFGFPVSWHVGHLLIQFLLFYFFSEANKNCFVNPKMTSYFSMCSDYYFEEVKRYYYLNTGLTRRYFTTRKPQILILDNTATCCSQAPQGTLWQKRFPSE